MSAPTSQAEYAADYLTWKRWAPEAFGQFTPTEEKSFHAVLTRTGQTLPPGANILEIGFGNGNFLSFAKQNNWNIRATEMNRHLVATAATHGYQVAHTQSLAQFETASFDLCVAFHVLEHIPQDHILPFLAEIKRVLKPSCCFIAVFPNGDSPFGLANQNGDVTHVTSLGSGKLQYFTSELNVEQLFCGGETNIIHVPHNPRQSLRNLAAAAAKALINLTVRIAFSQHHFAARNLVYIFKNTPPA